MASDPRQTLERIAHRVPVPEPAYERLLLRRDRKARNRRISALLLAGVLTLVSIAAFVRAFGDSTRPATPTPTPVDTGIFSGIGGWIAYVDDDGIWAIDPDDPDGLETRVRLSPRRAEPLAWSSDGSKLLIRARGGHALFVVHADGTETPVIDLGEGHDLSGGSFSPDGSTVVFADTFDPSGDAIYLIDADGGEPQLLRSAERRWYPSLGRRVRSLFTDPVFSPDGTQIAYLDGMGDHSNSLRVMNADGSGSRVILADAGAMPEGAHWSSNSIQWSPDGSLIAFDLSQIGIFVVRPDGSGLERLIPDGERPYWSPDGSRISYQSGSFGFGPLEIAAADGTVIRAFPLPITVRYTSPVVGPWNPASAP